MHSALKIANEIIKRGAAMQPPRLFTPMQILKLVYLCHGWMLGLYGKPLIKENIEAWKYGPVIPELYHALKGYRDNHVRSQISEGWGFLHQQTENLDPWEDAVVNQVIQGYGSLTGIQLSQITHAPNTPWSQTFRPDRFGLVISDDIITDHYQRLYRERNQYSGTGTNA